MTAIPKTHISDDRFAEYITELHEFSGSHRIPFGQPGDMAGLLRGLRTSSAFASEFGSMIRSIVLRERFQASELELLKVVVVAWGDVPKGDLSNKLPPAIEELRSIMQDLLRTGMIGTPVLTEPPARKSVDENDEFVSSIAQGQDHKRISTHRGFSSLKPMAAPVVNEEPRSGASRRFRIHGYPSETHGIAQTRRLDLSAGEIIAAGLTGVVVALLFMVGSVPIYRARVSVDLPATDPAGKSQTRIDVGSPAYALVSGALPGQVAELLLERPHPRPILQQDALSRGMRDLHLGGNETVLFADLVAETAHQVKVRRLKSPQVYEITCDSWSAQFAATFCNELLGMLERLPRSPSGSSQRADSVRIIDEAVGPGVQVYPRWYLQSFAGLVVGCLAGVSVGFIKRAEPEADLDKDDGG